MENFRDIYAYAYDAFNIFLENLTMLHVGKREKVIDDVLDFLTNKTRVYDNDFRNITTTDFNDLDTVKRVIMLIIVSKAYMSNYYDFIHDINAFENNLVLVELENMSIEDIVSGFYNRDDFIKDMIEDYFSYINRPYIFQSKCKSLIIKNEKIPVLLRLNPFEVLDLYEFIEDDKYTSSEEVIQTFMDIYEQSLVCLYNDEFGESDNYSCKDEFLVSIIFSKLMEKYGSKEKFIEVIKYILSNVYETVVTELNGHNNDYRVYINIVRLIESSSIEEVIERFVNNYDFTIEVIDAFLEGNDYLVEGDLIGKRDVFKRVGNVKLLRKLNPYYQEEEIVYKKIKETSE